MTKFKLTRDENAERLVDLQKKLADEEKYGNSHSAYAEDLRLSIGRLTEHAPKSW